MDKRRFIVHDGAVRYRRQFAANLLMARHQRGLSQAALGRRIGLDRAEISKFECAKRDPCLDMVVRLALGLEIPAGDLLRGIGELDDPLGERSESNDTGEDVSGGERR